MWIVLLVIYALLHTLQVSGKDYCSSSPCTRGICYNGVSNYTCRCPVDYHDNNCDTFVNYCSSLPCMNGATCSNMENDFLCQCKTGFTGRTCDRFVNYCSVLPCLNGGTCNETDTGFRCNCKKGFTGKICETTADFCQTQPCMNGGSCINSNTGFTCRCNSGFTGNLCQTTDNCQSQPCMNEGQCLNTDNGFNCQCSNGFVGPTCKVKLQDKTCNKLLIVTGVAMGVTLADPVARTCASNKQSLSDVVMIQYCSAPPVTSWTKGVQVISLCKYLPHYYPIAQFHKDVVTDSSGLFVSCLGIDSFQMVTQTCDSNVHIQNITWPASLAFYTVNWN